MKFICESMETKKKSTKKTKKSDEKSNVKKGDKIKVEYEGRLEDGTIFDKTEGRGPFEFEVGAGMVIPGFDKAVIGMKKSDEKEVKIKPEDAYGNPKPELVKKVPRDQLPAGQDPKEGMMVVIGLPNGSQIPAIIKKVSNKEIDLDLNHPLAGKTLIFKIKVVEVNSQ